MERRIKPNSGRQTAKPQTRKMGHGSCTETRLRKKPKVEARTFTPQPVINERITASIYSPIGIQSMFWHLTSLVAYSLSNASLHAVPCCYRLKLAKSSGSGSDWRKDLSSCQPSKASKLFTWFSGVYLDADPRETICEVYVTDSRHLKKTTRGMQNKENSENPLWGFWLLLLANSGCKKREKLDMWYHNEMFLL